MVMDLGETLAIVNLAGLIVVGFFGWTGIKAAKQQVLELMNRDLAEVRRYLRTSLTALDRVRDGVTDNREDINKIEVNLISMQDELEEMSRRLDDFFRFNPVPETEGEGTGGRNRSARAAAPLRITAYHLSCVRSAPETPPWRFPGGRHPCDAVPPAACRSATLWGRYASAASRPACRSRSREC